MFIHPDKEIFGRQCELLLSRVFSQNKSATLPYDTKYVAHPGATSTTPSGATYTPPSGATSMPKDMDQFGSL